MTRKKVPTTHLFLPITRTERQGESLIVEAYAYCNASVKSDKFNLLRAAMEEATADYFQFPAIREMHGSSAAGTGLDHVWDERGCKLTLKVVDPVAIKKVEEEVYRGLSVGVKPLILRGNDVTKCQWIETSLVDRPADPDAIILTTRGESLPAEVEADVMDDEEIARGDFTDQMAARESRLLRSAAIDTLASVLYDALCYSDATTLSRIDAMNKAMAEFRAYVSPLMERGEMFIEIGGAPIARADHEAEIQRLDTQISALRSERDDARTTVAAKDGEIAVQRAEIERLGKMPAAAPPVRFPEALQRTFQANADRADDATKATERLAEIKRMDPAALAAMTPTERGDLATEVLRLERTARGD